MALCVAAYGFPVSERSLFPPSGDKTSFLKAPDIPPTYRPRGSARPPQRHVEASIVSIRINLARALARRLFRCPCCQRANL